MLVLFNRRCTDGTMVVAAVGLLTGGDVGVGVVVNSITYTNLVTWCRCVGHRTIVGVVGRRANGVLVRVSPVSIYAVTLLVLRFIYLVRL